MVVVMDGALEFDLVIEGVGVALGCYLLGMGILGVGCNSRSRKLSKDVQL